ncbi:hypothetical protein E2C01_093605 [Portunus trituberculatus]|uniref:Uncharacterized protein n=1 Tax=Portunus trituberculatus TaxID=210409 RepID=A0A5B7JUM3_PORTR|nr:hypothetical protein [Portunus trituberculatus]
MISTIIIHSNYPSIIDKEIKDESKFLIVFLDTPRECDTANCSGTCRAKGGCLEDEFTVTECGKYCE